MSRFWRDADTSKLKVYVASHYCDFSDRNFENAFAKVTEDRAFNPVKEYLDNLPKWDGVKRLENISVQRILKESKKIKRIGHDHGGHWEIIE